MKQFSALLLSILILQSCGVDSEVLDYSSNNTSITLVYPENNSESNNGLLISDSQNELIFLWMDENNNTPYTVHITNNNTFQNQILESNETQLPIVLEIGSAYTWYVTNSSGSVSQSWSFANNSSSIESSKPLPAEAISPVSGASISRTSTSVNLIWKGEDSDEDIVGYDLYFGKTTNPTLLEELIKGTRYDDIPVEAGETYYWKIITRDSVGNESTSAIFSFTVG